MVCREGHKRIVKSPGQHEHASVGTDHNTITTQAAAVDYLRWSDQFENDFGLIREALKRPYARMEGDYDQPFAVQVPNFVTLRSTAQTLANGRTATCCSDIRKTPCTI